MDQTSTQEAIQSGKTILGIELGSTRIKAVLIGEDHTPLASGGHEWENRYENGVWTYTLEDVWTGLQGCFGDLLRRQPDTGVDYFETGVAKSAGYDFGSAIMTVEAWLGYQYSNTFFHRCPSYSRL